MHHIGGTIKPASVAALVVLLFAPGLVGHVHAQMPVLPHDPNLIGKLFSREFNAIGDDNVSRLDIQAILVALSRGGCRAPADRAASGPGSVFTAVQYVRYLNSDSETGQYPSKEYMGMMALILVGGDMYGAFAQNPNTLRMTAEIARGGCASPRVLTIGRHVLELLDDRIAGRRPASSRAGSNATAPRTVLPVKLVLGEWKGTVTAGHPGMTVALRVSDASNRGARIDIRSADGNVLFAGSINRVGAGPGLVAYQTVGDIRLEGRLSDDEQSLEAQLTVPVWQPPTVPVRLLREAEAPNPATVTASAGSPAPGPATSSLPQPGAPPPRPSADTPAPPASPAAAPTAPAAARPSSPAGMAPIRGEWTFRRVGQPDSPAVTMIFDVPRGGDPRRPALRVSSAGGLEGAGQFASGSGSFVTSGRGGRSKRATLTLDENGVLRMIVQGGGSDPLPIGEFVGMRNN